MVNRLFLLIMIFGVMRLSAQEIKIVDKGMPVANIAIEANVSPNVKKAAELLQYYILEVSGAKLPIVNQSGKNSIKVGGKASDYSGIFRGKEDESYLLKSIRSSGFLIVGKTDIGTEFGVYDFLERFVGVTWLMPSDIGVYIPKSKNISIKTMNIIMSPAFKSRQLSPLDVNGGGDLNKWGRYNKLMGKISFHHNMNYFFDNKNIDKYDSNIFPVYNGKKYYPKSATDHSWQPNFSSSEFQKVSVNKIKEYFGKSKSSTFSLGINDTYKFGTNQMKGKNAKNYLGFDNYSDEYYSWVNNVIKEVNKTYPNKKYGLLAYYNVAEPPSSRIGVNSQVVPYITYERIRWSNTSIKQVDQNIARKWGKYVPELGWYDYLYGYTYLVPRIYPHVMAEYLKWGNVNKVKHFYGEIYPNWGEGPKYWLLAKLLWNPNQTVDVLLNDWYNKCVGKDAAQYLRQYYLLWENYWTKTMSDKPWFVVKGTFLPFNNVEYLKYVDDKMIRDSDALLENVCLKAKGSLEKKRAQAIFDMWTLYKLSIQIFKDKGYSNLAGYKQSSSFMNLLEKLKMNPLHKLTTENIIRNMK